MAYLDDTGLAYFWGKIKAWAQGLFALIGHTHPSSDVTLMTGYSKPSASSAIAASDTLNQAVGKLEKGMETADGNAVHKTGNEVVQDIKIFHNTIGRLNHTASAFTIINDLSVADASYYVIQANTGDVSVDTLSQGYRRFFIRLYPAGVSNDSSLLAQLVSLHEDGNGANFGGVIDLGRDANGVPFVRATDTSTRRVDTRDVVTRGFIPLDTRIVHTANNETINDLKFFTSSLSVSTNFAHDTIPSGDFVQRIILQALPAAPWNSSAFLLLLMALRQRAIATPGHPSSSSAYQSAVSMRTTAADGNWAGLDLVVRDDTHEVFATLTYNNSVFQNLGWYGRLTGTVYSDAISSTAGAQNYSDVVNVRRTDSTRVFTMRSGYDSSGNYVSFIVHPFGGAAGGSFTLSNSGPTTNSMNSWCGLNWNPSINNNYTLGIDGRRWKQLYANSATINTSDERIKSSISEVPDAVLDAWAGVDFVQFKFNDAVSEKGEAAARLHSGVIAQRVDEAFRRAGLDASRYGLFCYDEWDADPDYGQEPDSDSGNARVPMAAGSLYSIRYAEALCMEAAYMRRENARLKERVASLEDRLAALELRLGSE